MASGGNGVRGIEVSASDQLAGVGVPSNLVNFYEEDDESDETGSHGATVRGSRGRAWYVYMCVLSTGS